MAKNFEKIVYSLLEIVTNFEVTDDIEYPILWIEDGLISIHNSLMREAFDNNKLGPELLQLQKNVPVKPLTESVQIDGVPINIKSELCYSDIPELVSGIEQKNIDYVGTVDLANSFSYRGIKYLVDDDGVLYKLPQPVYSILGNKLLFSKEEMLGIQIVSIIGYFRDPRDVNTYDPNTAFQTPSEFKLEMLTLKHILSAKGVTPDIINDAQRALNQAREREEERSA